MTPWEVAVAQAGTTGHLIRFTQARIVKRLRVRAVLPTPAGAPSVRIALGTRKATLGDLQVVYEIPLFEKDETTVGPWEVVGRVRHEAGGLRIYSSSQVGEVMGTPLITLEEPTSTPPRPEDLANSLLTTLSCPPPSYEDREAAESLLVGFLYLRDGLMRLYVRRRGEPEVVACDVRLAEVGPAVIAEVFSRAWERELWRVPQGDAHCVGVVDLVHGEG